MSSAWLLLPSPQGCFKKDPTEGWGRNLVLVPAVPMRAFGAQRRGLALHTKCQTRGCLSLAHKGASTRATGEGCGRNLVYAPRDPYEATTCQTRGCLFTSSSTLGTALFSLSILGFLEDETAGCALAKSAASPSTAASRTPTAGPPPPTTARTIPSTSLSGGNVCGREMMLFIAKPKGTSRMILVDPSTQCGCNHNNVCPIRLR